MSKESKTYGERQKIFSCCFNDEQTVRAQGGVPTGVTFSNGRAVFGVVNNKIEFDRSLSSGTYSVRIKFKTASDVTNGQILVDFRGSITGAGYLYISTGALVSLDGTKYINGVASSTLLGSTEYDCVVSGTSLKTVGNILIGLQYGITAYFKGEVELLEVYNYALTSQEVTNLYNNSRLRDIQYNKTEQLGAELVVDGGFDDPTKWIMAANWVVSGGKISYDDLATSGFYPATNVPVTAGKRYRVVYTISDCAGNASIIFNSLAGATFYEYAGYVNKANGSYSEILTCSTSRTNWAVYANSGGTGPFKIDNLSIKEVLVERTKLILNVDACCGIRNKLSGDVYYTNLIPDDSSYFATDGSAWWTAVGTTVKVWYFDDLCMLVNRSGSGGSFYKSILTSGKTYHYSISVRSTVGQNVKLTFGTTDSASYAMTSTWQTYTGTVVANGAILYITADAAGVWFIDNIIIKEIIPSVVNTATEVYKDGDVNVMKFDGSTSKIDCGSYDTLVGDKTFVAWINTKSIQSTSRYNLFTNAVFNLFVSGENGGNKIALDNNGIGHSIQGTLYSLTLKKWYLIVVTRTSAGIGNIYINGILNSTANQAGDPPVAGSNILIGGITARYYDGLMDKVRIIDGILTPTEISQIFTAERGKYNV